ncbi:hypothetical protein L7F22_010843 [Adiantum nelumboides]|nr:hypothetical protein [Adiantum nelumboides]
MSFSSVMIKTLLILIGTIVDHLHFSCGIGMFPQQLQLQQLAPDCNNTSSMRCPNLGNISLPSPFILDELKSCIPNVPADFVLTNCNSNSNVSAPSQQAAFWQSFTRALPPQDVQRGLIGPPAVIGLTSDAPHGANPIIHINLTWDSSSMGPQPSINGSPWSAPSACRHPHSFTNLSQYFPTFINLSKLYTANTDIFISSNTKFLLFNCSKSPVDGAMQMINGGTTLQVVDDSSLCQLYKDSCSSNLTAMFGAVPDCYELHWIDDTELLKRYNGIGYSYLPLQSILNSLSCTHSEVFVISSSGGADQIAGVEQWLPGVMQLLITSKCAFCEGYILGECIYTASNHCNCTSKEGPFVLLAAGICTSKSLKTGCWHIGSISICNSTFQFTIVYGGIGMGALLFLIALCCCAYRWGSRSMKNRRLKRKALWERQHSVASYDDLIASDLIDLIGLAERPVEYSYKCIEFATRSFSSLVGKGGFGVVFKGELSASRNNVSNQEQYSSTSKEIAVKVLDVSFPAMAFDMAINKGDFVSLLDQRLTMSFSEQKQQEKPMYSIEEQIRIAVLVALWCIQDSAASRPSMSLVVQFLEGVAAVCEHPPSPTIASASEGSIQSHTSSDLSGTNVTPR